MPVQHYILIADYKKQNILLSVPNLYLYEKTRSSIQTSKRYATVISKFYRFLGTQKVFKSLAPGDYHTIVRNLHIKQWQVARHTERVRKQSPSPSSATIFDDALIVRNFFAWVVESPFTCNVNIKKETWVLNVKSDRMLNYIKRKAGVRINSDAIRVLDRESRQHTQNPLITDWEIKLLLESYPDSVYATLFCLGLATALRPIELCNFPYLGKGKNKHILPRSQMPKDEKKFAYQAIGKGNKLRNVIIPAYALDDIEQSYTKNEYPQRRKKYKEKFGKACPPSILFLTADGEPVTPKKISDATTYAKKLAYAKNPNFSMLNDFYQARHWWPTMMVIQHHGDKLLTEAADVLDRALGQAIMNQMGHSKITTTYKHYLNVARVLIMSKQGYVFEMISEDFNIHTQIQEFG
ncbi:hypothetical protein [Pseudomonas sp. SDO55104_S430]